MFKIKTSSLAKSNGIKNNEWVLRSQKWSSIVRWLLSLIIIITFTLCDKIGFLKPYLQYYIINRLFTPKRIKKILNLKNDLEVRKEGKSWYAVYITGAINNFISQFCKCQTHACVENDVKPNMRQW